MDNNKDKNWKNMNDFLSKANDNLNVLEEEIDLNVQKEYFKLAEQLTNQSQHYKQLRSDYLENINDIFDENISEDVKKEMLVILASMNDISVFRTIESFSKTVEGILQKWSIIALQQSRMLILSSLLDEPGIFISTGLGGHGKMLRYFCVFFYNKKEELEEFEQNTVANETDQALKPLKGEIEKIEFHKYYLSILMLLPIDTDLKILFQEIINECNTYGNFLHENMIVTNIKKLTEYEIEKIIHKKGFAH